MSWLQTLKPVFTIKQLERLSNIFDNSGQGVFVVVVLTPLVSGLDRIKLSVLLFGVVATFICWMFSVWLAQKGEKI